MVIVKAPKGIELGPQLDAKYLFVDYRGPVFAPVIDVRHLRSFLT